MGQESHLGRERDRAVQPQRERDGTPGERHQRATVKPVGVDRPVRSGRLRIQAGAQRRQRHPARRHRHRRRAGVAGRLTALSQDDDGLRSPAAHRLDVKAPQLLATVQHQLHQVPVRPYVKVDRVALGLQPRRVLSRLRLIGRLARRHQPRPFQVVVAARALGSVLVIIHQVPQGRPRTTRVKRVALVRDRIEQHSTRPQLPQMRSDRPDRILAVLEEVVGDDEVNRLRGHRPQPLAVIDHIDRSQLPPPEAPDRAPAAAAPSSDPHTSPAHPRASPSASAARRSIPLPRNHCSANSRRPRRHRRLPPHHRRHGHVRPG